MFCHHRLVLPYEQHLSGSSDDLSKAKEEDTADSAESTKKLSRSKKLQTGTKKNKVASQVSYSLYSGCAIALNAS